jgi:hypothetical protein
MMSVKYPVKSVKQSVKPVKWENDYPSNRSKKCKNRPKNMICCLEKCLRESPRQMAKLTAQQKDDAVCRFFAPKSPV